MIYECIEVAVVPSELPDDHLAKDSKSLACPFCGSQFEPMQCDVSNETCKTERWEREKMICASMKTQTPIALRCKGCGIEIHNLTLLSWFYGEQVKE